MLQKRSAPLNFAQGLDTKTDPKQVPFGKFLVLQNSIFTTGMRLSKRNGYSALGTVSNASYLTTFGGNLTAIGTSLSAYSSSSSVFYSKGNLQPITLSVLPTVRSALNQTQCDSVVATNGLVCTVYTEVNNGFSSYKYTIQNSTTGQNIINPTAIPAGSGLVGNVYKFTVSAANATVGATYINNGYTFTVLATIAGGTTLYMSGTGPAAASGKLTKVTGTGDATITFSAVLAITGTPRVFLFGGYFIIAFTNVISTVAHLQYIAISTNDPTSVTAAADLAAAYDPSTTLSWDGVVLPASSANKLFFAYYTTTGGAQIAVSYLSSALIVATPQSFAGEVATLMSLTADLTILSAPVIYVAYYNLGGTLGKAIAVDQNLNKLMTPTTIITSVTVNNIVCTAQSGVLQVAYEVANTYGYTPFLPTNLLRKLTVTLPATVTTGSVGTDTIFVRSVGLASKAFLMNNVMYMLAAYQSSLQSTYFLIDISGNVISRFAYENGGGYLTQGLPQAQVVGTTVNIAYRYKDLIQSTSTSGLAQSIGPAGESNIYSQTGINLISLNYTSNTLSSSEIGSNLNLSGGMLWAYDGQTLTEQGFHLFPDDVTATQLADPTPTGTTTTGSAVLTGLSSVAGIVPGMIVTDTTNAGDIPANTTVLSVGTTTVTMSANAAGSHVGDSLKFVGAVSAQKYYHQVVYEWTDAQGNIIRSSPSIPVTVTPTAGHTSIVLNIPYLRLTYKTDVKIVIYRWSEANQLYYQITNLTAPTLNVTTSDSLTYTDILNDTAIVGNSLIYTTGGVIEDIAGPAATATTLFDDRLWLIDAEDQNLLWFSKQVIEATPVEMSDLFTFYVAPSTGAQGSTGIMRCLFPMDEKLILFKKEAIYYINGTGPDNTGANNNYSQPIFVTSSVGCDNQKSIVLIPNGVMFQSDKGIWLLGRDLSTTYIGAPVEEFNSYTVNSAVVIPGTTQVRFTLSNGITLMYDYYFQQWGTFVGVPAISATLYNNLHTYINSSGQVSQETPGLYLDNGNPVLMNFTTSWLNLTGLQGYQRAYFFYILGQYITPHKLQVGIAYDYNPTFITAPLITPVNGGPAYGDIGPYGQGNYGGASDVENWRVFLKQQRCQAFQISIQEIYDPSLGIAAGAGLNMSGLNIIYGSKQSFRPQPAAKSVG